MRRASLALLLACLTGCVTTPRRDLHPTPKLTLEDATALVPEKVSDREGWALDVLTALDAHKIWADVPAVCSVLAIIEQESGYEANPAVPGLAKIVQAKLDGYADKYGPLGKAAIDKLLEGKAAGSKATFAQRLERAKTERDLDLVFRDMLAYYESEFPATFKLLDLAAFLSGKGGLDALNPITTAGSMQVSVKFALEHAESDKVEEWQVRDRLYTRAGGVYFGTLRLLGYDAAYDDPVYRFADYNAGFYSSRNAAVQEQVAALTGRKLVLDGDLLAYDKDGEPSSTDSSTLQALLAFRARYAAKALDESDVRDDARQEKSRALEETQLWRAIKDAYAKKTGKAPAYARLPDVAVRSPKMKKERSTSWFAESVNRRYKACLDRAR